MTFLIWANNLDQESRVITLHKKRPSQMSRVSVRVSAVEQFLLRLRHHQQKETALSKLRGSE